MMASYRYLIVSILFVCTAAYAAVTHDWHNEAEAMEWCCLEFTRYDFDGRVSYAPPCLREGQKKCFLRACDGDDTHKRHISTSCGACR